MIGRHVSHFYIIRTLGSGGMGVVYEAQDTRLPRSVALKVLKPALSRNTRAVRRFKREARLASSLNHPNICTILDVDEDDDGQYFIAMELLQGQALKERLASGPMELDDILNVGLQVSDALAAAHDRGIMHRDITPGNIFIAAGGLVKLLDFGLAKHFASLDDDGAPSEDLTETGAVAGTLHHIAPEQFIAGGSVDHRCDLFSLGTVLYQMATGAKPFQAKSRTEIIGLIREQPHVPIRQLAPQQSAQLEGLIDRLLAKRPADRYQSALALRADFDLLKKDRTPLPQSSRTDLGVTRTSIAVLPFEILGPPSPTLEHLRDGMAEDISGRLSEIPNLRVAPRTSTRQVVNQTVKEIGRQLNVQLVLEGSLQQSEHRVKVMATLLNAASERAVLPSLRLQREYADVLAAQSDLAREIVGGIVTAVSQAGGSQYTRNPHAYHAFRKGQHHWKKRFEGGWRQALDEFQEAVNCDGEFAVAHVALAAAYNFLGFYCHLKPDLAFRMARQSIERALSIDDTLATAHAELALMTLGSEWDWEGAEQEFRTALRLDASSAVTRIYYAWLLTLVGREDAGLIEARTARTLAPSSSFTGAGLAQALYLSKRYDEAIALCTECLEFNPLFIFAIHIRAQCYQLKAMHHEAIDGFELAAALTGRAPFWLGLLGHCYGEAGRRDEALRLVAELDQARRSIYVPPQCYVYIYAGLGLRDRALQYQEQAYEDGASPFNYLTPNIRDLYALDPQHKKRLEQMRLVL